MPNTLLYQIGIFGIQINAMIAAFNMLPISILDGNKVLSWNLPVFVLLLGASFAVLVSTPSISSDFLFMCAKNARRISVVSG